MPAFWPYAPFVPPLPLLKSASVSKPMHRTTPGAAQRALKLVLAGRDGGGAGVGVGVGAGAVPGGVGGGEGVVGPGDGDGWEATGWLAISLPPPHPATARPTAAANNRLWFRSIISLGVLCPCDAEVQQQALSHEPMGGRLLFHTHRSDASRPCGLAEPRRSSSCPMSKILALVWPHEGMLAVRLLSFRAHCFESSMLEGCGHMVEGGGGGQRSCAACTPRCSRPPERAALQRDATGVAVRFDPGVLQSDSLAKCGALFFSGSAFTSSGGRLAGATAPVRVRRE